MNYEIMIEDYSNRDIIDIVKCKTMKAVNKYITKYSSNYRVLVFVPDEGAVIYDNVKKYEVLEELQEALTIN